MRYLGVPVLLAVAAAVAWLDDDAGLRTWWHLRSDVAAAEERTDALRAEIRDLRREARALRSDPAAQERAIREELGWARPGESVVVWPSSRKPSISLTE